MTSKDAESAVTTQRTPERCRGCGRFCGVVYRYRGPNYTEVRSCVYCGINVPKCAKGTGTVCGCQNPSTHEGTDGRYWCDDHAPAGADPLPYKERENHAE